MKNVIDSSVWIRHIQNGDLPTQVLPVIDQPDDLVVPTIIVLEVSKWLRRSLDPRLAARVLFRVSRGHLVPLDMRVALDAARWGAKHRLALADSIIYATARRYGAMLWTFDKHFDGLPGVRYFDGSD